MDRESPSTGLETGFADVGGYSSRLFTPNPLNHGKVNDPELAALDAAQRLKTNEAERKAIFWDLQRKASEKMYYIPYHFPVDWQPYYVAQPWVGGFGWHQPYIEQYPGGAGQILSQYWYDASKKS